MTFDAILSAILNDCGHGLGAALMGPDGIAIEQIEVAGEPQVDPVALGVEFGRILSETRKAADAVGAGSVGHDVDVIRVDLHVPPDRAPRARCLGQIAHVDRV